MKKRVLVVGGAGYIGSCCAKVLAEDGHEPIVFDSLSSGHTAFAKFGPLVEGDIRDRAAVDAALRTYRPQAVLHFAAKSLVGESMRAPLDYFENNVSGSIVLLQACVEAEIETFVFSSTAAVYGEAEKVPIPLDAPLQPVNPYGTSKMIVERILADVVAADGRFGATVFRYFNAAGAHPDGDVGERHDPETHLIPNVLEAVRNGARLKLFGDDYDTPDGTCVRDYIHVVDLVRAHILALERPARAGQVRTFNLGSGNGFSVKAVIETCGRVVGRPVAFDIHPRRPGDPPRLVAGDLERVADALGWTATHSDIDRIVADAWNWHRQPPKP